jgi:regulator of replication initiation timing
VKAFKQALFGTPQATTPAPPTFNHAERTNDTAESTFPSKAPQFRQLQPSETQTKRETGNPDTAAMKFDVVEFLQNESPAKPTGILMTPGTAPGRRKQVTFGTHVVNNEGKTTKYSKSGLPDDCPGKFPSPFTPKLATPANKLQKTMAAVKRNIPQNRSENINTKVLEGKKDGAQVSTRSKDDSDITSDLNFPASSSGRYWKVQYEEYAARSESEMKRLIAKHKLAKDYARMKDEEATTFQTRLEYDRKKHKELEKSMEKQLKDMRERLRITMAENSKLKMELALMRQSFEGTLAKPNVDSEQTTFPETYESKPSQPTSNKSPPKISKLETEPEIEESGGKDLWLDIYGKGKPRSRLSRQSARSELRDSETRSSRRRREAQKSMESLEEFRHDKDHCVRLYPEPAIEQLPLPTAIPLGERSPNIVSTPSPSPKRRHKASPAKSNAMSRPLPFPASSPAPAKPNSASGGISHANIIHITDTVPLDGLDLQAEQPTTPRNRASKASSNVRGRTPRSSGGSKMESARVEDAKARIAARKKSRTQLTATASTTPKP